MLESKRTCPSFLQILQALYHTLTEQISLKGYKSDLIANPGGKGQGCLLTLSFFAITIAIAILSSPDFKDILYGSQEHSCTLFPGDVPPTTIPNFIKLLTSFSLIWILEMKKEIY